MSDTAIVGIVGIIGTLLGTILGGYLEGTRADRVLRRQAYHDYSAHTLESLYKLQEIKDTARVGGLMELRPDFVQESFRTLALVQIVARPGVLAAAVKLSNVTRDLTAAMVPDPTVDTAKAQAEAMAALDAFNDAASLELSPWWVRLRHRAGR